MKHIKLKGFSYERYRFHTELFYESLVCLISSGGKKVVGFDNNAEEIMIPEGVEEKDITNTLIDVIPFKNLSRIANEVKEINK